jgi:hypothetical protein
MKVAIPAGSDAFRRSVLRFALQRGAMNDRTVYDHDSRSSW